MSRVPVVFFLMLATLAGAARADELSAWAANEVEQLVPLYEHLHSHPELSTLEQDTSRRIAEELAATGCDVTAGIGGYGVVGLLKNGDGPTVMFRCDLDALPIVEETGLPYASLVVAELPDGSTTGVMHACGHDLHMTNLIGLARYLSTHRENWNGTAMFVGQPDEEKTNGAERMIGDGLFERFPKPQFALALHCDPEMVAGNIGWRAGYVCANTDSCDIVIKGRGGHGSKPELCIDPVVQAAQLIVDLQTIVSREVSPFDPAVITVGSIHGGSKHNIISDRCKLQLTIRSYSANVRDRLHRSIERKAQAVATSFHAPAPDVTFSEGTPALFNDEDLVARVTPAFVEALGDEHVHAVDPSMGGEDFSFYGLAGVPVFMFRLGTVTEEDSAASKQTGAPLPTLHSARYHPDLKPSLKTALTASAAAMISLMPRR